MLLAAKLRDIMTMPQLALEKGCSRAELLLAKDIIVDERVRMKCRLNACGQYGQNLLCPPNVLPLEKTRSMLEKYSFVMIMQLTRPVLDDNYRQVFDDQKRQFGHHIIDLEQEAFHRGFMFAVGLAAGHCDICPACAAKEGKSVCRNPATARPSMEALGMDVAATCRQVAFPTGFIKGEVTLTGMLLID